MVQKILVMVATPTRHLPKRWDEGKGCWVLQFTPNHERFLTELEALSLDDTCPYEFMFATVEGGRTWGRCRLVSHFRKMRRQYPNMRWLYWHDDDVEQTGAGLLRLLSHRQPVVGAMYTTKEKDCHWVANFMHEVQVQANGLLQVVEVGLGALLTHYQVYDVIEACNEGLLYTDRTTGERHLGFFQEVVLDKMPYSEDYFFCLLMRHAKLADPTEDDPDHRKLGIGIFVDTELRLRHYGGDGKAWPEEWPPIPMDQKVEA